MFQRMDPLVSPAGDCMGDIQVGDAYEARWRWAWPDADGHWFYVTLEAAPCEENGRRHVLARTEYMVSTDPAHPGDGEVWSDAEYFEASCDEARLESWLAARKGPVGQSWLENSHWPLPAGELPE